MIQAHNMTPCFALSVASAPSSLNESPKSVVALVGEERRLAFAVSEVFHGS